MLNNKKTNHRIKCDKGRYKRKLFFKFWPILIIFVLSNFQSLLFTQRNTAFGRISCEQEFSKATITDIRQGPKDFIWFATYNGLCRYDGYKCTAYKHDPTNHRSISSNDLNCLCLDSEGVLWVGTYDGLNRFNRVTETFTHYRYNENDPQSLSHNVVSVIYEDKNDYLWIGTFGGGSNRFDKKTGKFKRFKHDPKNHRSLSNNIVTSICQDCKGVLWIGTEDGLNKFSRKEEIFTRYKQEQGNPGTLKNNRIGIVYEDRKGNLWIGTWGGGLCRYIREKDGFDHYFINTILPDSTSANNIRIASMNEDRFGTFWIGTYGDGLYEFSREKGSFEPFPYDVRIPYSLNSKFINKIYEDKTGLLWIGTLGGGGNIYDRKREKFSHFTLHPSDENSLSSDTVLSFCEAPNEAGEILWVGTYSGLNRFDIKENKFTHFKHNPADLSSISSNIIRNIFVDSYNVCWVATDNGLNQLDPKTYRFTSFKNESRNPESISDNQIVTICENKKRRLWIGTGKGLNLFNREEKSFTRFVNKTGNPYSISEDYILCMSEQLINGESVLWIGTYKGGLNKFIVEEGKFYHYKTTTPGTRGNLSSDIIRSIYIDKENTIWLGTDGGLNRFDPKSEEFFVYSENDGLSNNRVYGILEDESGHLWLSTHNGLNRFNKNTGEFKTFNEGNGVPIRSFNMGAYCRNQRGEMFFGGMNGFVSFFPEEVETNSHIPNIVITDFKIYDQSVGIGEHLKQSITEAVGICLTYRDNMFSFEFAALDYTWPENNQYKYKMEGFDKDWVETDAKNRSARYTNLGHGKYTFKVKGSNNDGVWNDTGISLNIIITPPFWKTWWFRIVLGVSFILFLLFFYLQRTNRLRKKLSEQQRIQVILKQAHDEMERARDLAEIRFAENEKLLTAISSIFIAVDSNGTIFQWNKPAEIFFEIHRDDAIRQPFAKVLKDCINGDKLNEIIEKGLKQDKSSKEIETSVDFRPKGKGIKLLLSGVSPIMDIAGRKLGFLLLAEDITRRKEEEMQRILSQKLESLGRMTVNIAHEIKTPLQYIGRNGRFICDSFSDLLKFFESLNQSLTDIKKSNPDVAANIKKIIEEYKIELILKEIPKASDHIVNGVSRLSTIIQSMKNYSFPDKDVVEEVETTDNSPEEESDS